MDFGITMFPTDYAVSPIDLCRAAEDAGFESFLLPEHSHIPVSRETPFPAGGEIPREYKHTHDPFVALGACAAITSTIKLGTGLCLLVQRDPILTAKAVASLDHLSKGRALFGVGAGWNVEEMRNHGTDYHTRWSLLRERVLAVKAIWSHEEAAFHGRHVDFDAIWQWPKPVGRPSIILGGNGPGILARVVDYADEWMPISSRAGQPLEERIEELTRLAAEAGRGPIPVSVYGARPRPDALEQLQKAGVSRAVFWLQPGPPEEVLPRVIELGQLARQFA
ncbi:MAG: LLM class F420-dependent oxidoreductase [Acidobacteria bacterium]|nr:LLM class F420-dependent oxidoreductase [Acidobacteriota bacterium]